MEEKQVNQNMEFVRLAKEYEVLKEKTELARQSLEQSMLALTVGAYIQDPETMAVYKIIEPKGKFVYFSSVDYVRTALEGEKRGDLAKTEAQALGFILKKV